VEGYSRNPSLYGRMGYEKPGLEESEVFLFNPSTQSNVQIDFTPAGRYSTFSQESIEWLTTAATGVLRNNWRKIRERCWAEIGHSPCLKGVPFQQRNMRPTL
jgi:hypothetical protein